MSDLVNLYERSQGKLRAVAARYVGDEAEDMVQEAFLRALRYGHGFRGDAAAQAIYKRLVAEFADQKETFALASARLSPTRTAGTGATLKEVEGRATRVERQLRERSG